MRNALRLAMWAFVCVAAVPTLAHAQASITGVVRDSSGGVLPGVTVEASSPALIEKVRSVVTDSGGIYRIVDLRPGTYSVSFTLPGFNVVKQDGHSSSPAPSSPRSTRTSAWARIQETVTVSGESPIVDTQNTTQQRVFDQQVIEAIPAGRSHINMAVLIPGLAASQPGRGALQDVGGTNNLQNTTFVDPRQQAGRHARCSSTASASATCCRKGSSRTSCPTPGPRRKSRWTTRPCRPSSPSAASASTSSRKRAATRLRGSVFATGVNSAWQGTNIDDDLQGEGAAGPERDEEGLRHQPVGGRTADARQAVVLLLGALAEERELRGRPLREPATPATRPSGCRIRTGRSAACSSSTQKGVNLRLTSQLAAEAQAVGLLRQPGPHLGRQPPDHLARVHGGLPLPGAQPRAGGLDVDASPTSCWSKRASATAARRSATSTRRKATSTAS